MKGMHKILYLLQFHSLWSGALWTRLLGRTNQHKHYHSPLSFCWCWSGYSVNSLLQLIPLPIVLIMIVSSYVQCVRQLDWTQQYFKRHIKHKFQCLRCSIAYAHVFYG